MSISVKKVQKDGPSICVLGVSLSNSNLGVQALSQAALGLWWSYLPETTVTILGSSRDSQVHEFTLGARTRSVLAEPIRYCVNVFAANHIAFYLVYALISKALSPTIALRLSRRHSGIRALLGANAVLDITGGDSFSDIYGTWRLLRGSLNKLLARLYSKRLVFLPQTYGPFGSAFSRVIARIVLSQAEVVYSRDHAGADCVRTLVSSRSHKPRVDYAPDVAFCLPASRSVVSSVRQIEELKNNGKLLFGLNVSGLLLAGGYANGKMPSLKENYERLIVQILLEFLNDETMAVMLFPHVLAGRGTGESDIEACEMVYRQVPEHVRDRCSLVEGSYGAQEAKFLIGKCDFFAGARMHSCIAALSQCVATVGMAYSDKFLGVFDVLSMGDWVADLRDLDGKAIIKKLKEGLLKRNEMQLELRHRIGCVQNQVQQMFEALTSDLTRGVPR